MLLLLLLLLRLLLLTLLLRRLHGITLVGCPVSPLDPHGAQLSVSTLLP